MKSQFLLVATTLFTFLQQATSSCSTGETQVGSNCICQLPNVKFNNTCVSTCPSSYYLDTRSQACIKCPFGCETCTSDTSTCTKCHTGFILSQGLCTCFNTGFIYQTAAPCINQYPLLSNGTEVCATCLTACPYGYYYNALTHTCSACHSTCANCTGPLLTQCLKCRSGYSYNPYLRMCTSSCLSSMTGDSEGFCVPNTCSGVVNFFNLINLTCQSSCANKVISLAYTKNLCGNCDASCLSQCYNQSDSSNCKDCVSASGALLKAVGFTSTSTKSPVYQCGAITTNLNFSSVYNSFVYCFPYCKTCTVNPEICTSCASSSDYLTPAGNCISECLAPSFQVVVINNITYCFATEWPSADLTSTTSTNFFLASKVIVPVFLILSQLANPGISSILLRYPYLNMYVYLRYLKINYPIFLYDHFKAIDPVYNIFPITLPTSWANLSAYYPPPSRYSRFGMDGLFLTNFWPFLTTFLIVFLVTMLFLILKLDKEVAVNSDTPKPSNHFTIFFVWNYLLSFYFQMIFPAALMMLVEYQSLLPDMNSYSVLSLIANLFFLIFSIIFPCKKLIPRVQEAYTDLFKNKLTRPSSFTERFKFLYIDFKFQNPFTLYFVFIIQIRLILVAIFFTLPADNPMLQTGFFVGCNLFMTVALLYFRPYHSKIKNIEIVFYEIISLAINSMVFLISYYDTKDNSSLDTRNFAFLTKEALSSGVLISQIILSFSMILFAFAELVNIWRKVKFRKVSKINAKASSLPPEKQQPKVLGDETADVVNLDESVTHVLSPKKEIPRKVVRFSDWEAKAKNDSPALKISTG